VVYPGLTLVVGETPCGIPGLYPVVKRDTLWYTRVDSYESHEAHRGLLLPRVLRVNVVNVRSCSSGGVRFNVVNVRSWAHGTGEGESINVVNAGFVQCGNEG